MDLSCMPLELGYMWTYNFSVVLHGASLLYAIVITQALGYGDSLCLGTDIFLFWDSCAFISPDIFKQFLEENFDAKAHATRVIQGLAISQQLGKLAEGINLLDKEIHSQVNLSSPFFSVYVPVLILVHFHVYLWSRLWVIMKICCHKPLALKLWKVCSVLLHYIWILYCRYILYLICLYFSCFRSPGNDAYKNSISDVSYWEVFSL